MVVLGKISKWSYLYNLAPLLKLAAENTDVYFVYTDHIDPQRGGQSWWWGQRTFVRTVNMLIRTAQNPGYKEGWCVATDMTSRITVGDYSNPNLRITIERTYYSSSLADWGRTNSEFLEKTGLDLDLIDIRFDYPNPDRTWIWN